MADCRRRTRRSIALKLSVLAPQAYTADVDDTNTSGQLTVAYKVTDAVNTYGTYSTGFKSVGLNLNGVPTDALGKPDSLGRDGEARGCASRRVRSEDRVPARAIPRTSPFFNTGIDDYQTQVVNAQVGVLRGYLANAEKVRVRGAEFDGNARHQQATLVLWSGSLHGRHLRVVPGRAAAARGHRRSAGEGHLRLGPAGHLQVGTHVRRRDTTTRRRCSVRPASSSAP